MAKRIKSPYKAWRKYRNRENTCTTLHKVFDYATTTYAKNIAYQYVDGGQKYTYAEFRTKVERLSQRLSRFGIKHGDRVAILSQNMPNWVVAFFAATAYGRIAVPMLQDVSENEVTNILTHSESKVLFISQRMMGKLSEECRKKLTLLIDIETFEFIKKDKEDFKCNGWVKEPLPDDLATIIYTSGTTGKAKGVMLSHRNICQNLAASFKAQPAFRKDRFLSILPAAHAYEMCVSTLYSFYVGATCYTLQKPAAPAILLPAMKKVKPTIICSVPLIIEKVIKNSVWPTIQKSRIRQAFSQTAALVYWQTYCQNVRRQARLLWRGRCQTGPCRRKVPHRVPLPICRWLRPYGNGPAGVQRHGEQTQAPGLHWRRLLQGRYPPGQREPR